MPISPDEPTDTGSDSLEAAESPPAHAPTGAPLTLQASVVARFVTLVLTDKGVSVAGAEAIRSLMSGNVAPSRDTIFRAVRDAADGSAQSVPAPPTPTPTSSHVVAS
jgi:hypothetical protein